MNVLAAWLLALAPAWPLALTVALVLPRLRQRVLWLARGAALPALLIALTVPQAELPLPGLLLGASLQLDDPGRWLLTAVALLWLAGGWLAADWLRTPRRAVGFLLAMTGALWLPLAGDLPSLLAASVLAAYPLYALFGGRLGARVLLISVVIADLLILEALLLLAKDAGGLDLISLRSAIIEAHERTVLVALLLIGFGVKAGVTGLCYWLVPVLAEARTRHLGPAVAFTLAAGVMPWLRVLPLDEVQWPAIAALLPWVGLAGCVWAVAMGLLQATPRAVTAYTLTALMTLWLGLLGPRLDAPGAPTAMAAFFPAMLALSGVAMASLLLTSARVAGPKRIIRRVAAVLVALAILGGAMLTPAAGHAVQWLIIGSVFCVATLLGASVSPAAATDHQPATGRETLAGAALIVAGIVMTALTFAGLIGGPIPVARWPEDRLILLTLAPFAGIAFGLVSVRALARLPRVPAGDLLAVIEPAAIGLSGAWYGLGKVIGRWRDLLYTMIEHTRPRADRRGTIRRIEALLRRWSTATFLLVVVGAVAALLARLS